MDVKSVYNIAFSTVTRDTTKTLSLKKPYATYAHYSIKERDKTQGVNDWMKTHLSLNRRI